MPRDSMVANTRKWMIYAGDPTMCEGLLLQCQLYFAAYQNMSKQSKPPKSGLLLCVHAPEGKEVRDFPVYTSGVSECTLEFRIMTAESVWNEAALQAVIRNGLNENLLTELARCDDSLNLDFLIEILIETRCTLCSFHNRWGSRSTTSAYVSCFMTHSLQAHNKHKVSLLCLGLCSSQCYRKLRTMNSSKYQRLNQKLKRFPSTPEKWSKTPQKLPINKLQLLEWPSVYAELKIIKDILV